MRKFILIAIISQLCFSTDGSAQYKELMRSVRPGQAVDAWAVGENIFQVHAGGETGWTERSNDTAVFYNRYSSANALLCYGISHKFELDAMVGVRKDKFDVNNRITNASGLNLTAIGARYNILDGGYNGLSIGVQALVKIPGLSDDYKTTVLAPRVLALLGYNPSNAITITGNLGIDFDGVSPDAKALYALKFNFLLSNRIGSFIETYGSYQYRTAYNHIDLGLYWYITRNLMIDASVGMGAVPYRANEGFIGGGLTWRFSTTRHRRGWVYGEYR